MEKLKEYLWRYSYAIPAVVVLVIILILYVLGVVPVAAAPTGGGDVAECEIVATTGTIDIFYCEPTLGQPFKINSLGFMLNED